MPSHIIDRPRVVRDDCPSEVVQALVEEHNRLVDVVNEVGGDVSSPRPRKIKLTALVKES